MIRSAIFDSRPARGAAHHFVLRCAPGNAIEGAMIRPVFTEIVLFLAPFVLYAVFLWATQGRRDGSQILAAGARG